MHRRLALVLLLGAAACAPPPSPRAATGPGAAAPAAADRTQDPRVRSFRGQVPPDVLAEGRWVGAQGPTSLGAQGPTSLGAFRGDVVFLMFAFPR